MNSQSTLSDIRVWMVGGHNNGDPVTDPDNILGNMIGNLSLYLGPKNGTLSQIVTGTFNAGTNTTSNPDITIAQVLYDNGETYFGSNTPRALYQVDFNVSSLNLTYAAGASLSFGVFGDPLDNNGLTYLNCTDAATANAPEQDADGLVSVFTMPAGDESACTFYGSYAMNNATNPLSPDWVEPQDVNVQVFGTPEPTALTLLAAGLVGLLACARRKRKQASL